MNLSVRRLGAAPLALLLALAAAAALAGCSQDIETPTDRYALVIGVEAYKNANSLSWPEEDADEMANLLAETGWTVVSTLKSTQATLANIYDGIAALAEQSAFSKNSTILVYYSGHGDIDNSSAYIIPYDAVIDNTSTYISTSQLSDWLGAIPCKNKLLILDSCFSGDFVETGDSIDTIPTIFGPIDGTTESEFLKTALVNLGDLLAKSLLQSSNPAVFSVSAAGAEEFSMESDSLMNGVFTYYLLQAATFGDVNNDGYVTITEAYSFAKSKVKNVWDAQYSNNTDYWETFYNTYGYVPDFLPHISGGTGDLVLYVNK